MDEFQNIKIPFQVESIISHLENAGFDSYVVGGCVRDALLGFVPSDWDICTVALPVQIKDVAKKAGMKSIDTGIKHGTITVVCCGISCEVTTFRSEGTYSDMRHPDSVYFTNDICKDLARRDFTINAMAYNPRRGLIDIFNGRNDLQAGLIRCVGSAKKRFEEDALRIMRALRFASTLGFSIEKTTSQEVKKSKDLLSFIGIERLRDELLKTISGIKATKILLEYKEVFAVFIPQIKPMFNFNQHTPYHCYDVWEHSAYAVGFVDAKTKKSEPFFEQFSSSLTSSSIDNSCNSQNNCAKLNSAQLNCLQQEFSKLQKNNTGQAFVCSKQRGNKLENQTEAVCLLQSESKYDKDLYKKNESIGKENEYLNEKTNQLVRLSCLLHDIGKPHCFSVDNAGRGHFYGHAKTGAPIARNVCKELHMPTKDCILVEELVRYHDREIVFTKKSMRRLILKLGENTVRMLLEVRKCDILSHSRRNMDKNIDRWKSECKIFEETLGEMNVFSLKDLAINGHDIIALGVKAGPKIGEILNELFIMVVDGKFPNKRAELISEARKKIKNN